MFDLVGRRPAEFLAVSWTALVGPLAALLVIGGAIGLALRWLNRRWPGDVFRISWWRGVLTWVACALVLTTVSTVLRVRSDVQDNGLRRKPAGQALGAVVTFVSDVDRDGHGLLSRPGDPAPFDARVYPYALDVPGNGVDEDGIGGDLPVDTSVVAPVAPVDAPFAQTPPVILVMLETFRADLLGQTEGGRAVTPVLNRLAVEGGATTQRVLAQRLHRAVAIPPVHRRLSRAGRRTRCSTTSGATDTTPRTSRRRTSRSGDAPSTSARRGRTCSTTPARIAGGASRPSRRLAASACLRRSSSNASAPT